jgi:hypothetical protein
MDENFLEKIVYRHTFLIELMDGTQLGYNIDPNEKEDLERFLQYRVEESHDSKSKYMQFFTIEDRVVIIKIKVIKRLVFCFDLPVNVSEVRYIDNFKVAKTFENKLFIPDIIIKLRSVSEPLCYSDLDPESDFLILDDCSFSNKPFRKTGFITINDEDGEQNYIPVVNVECLETKRELIYSDEEWESLKQSKDLDNHKN